MEEAGRSEEGVSGGVADRVKGNISYNRILRGLWGGVYSRYMPLQQCKCQSLSGSRRRMPQGSSCLVLIETTQLRDLGRRERRGYLRVPSAGLGDLTRSRKALRAAVSGPCPSLAIRWCGVQATLSNHVSPLTLDLPSGLSHKSHLHGQGPAGGCHKEAAEQRSYPEPTVSYSSCHLPGSYYKMDTGLHHFP